MTARRSWTLWCDVPGCAEWHTANGTVKQARHDARACGWRWKRGLGDLCPAHMYKSAPAVSNGGVGADAPKLTAAQQRILGDVTAAGEKRYNGLARKPVERLAELGLVEYNYTRSVTGWPGRTVGVYTVRLP